MGGIPELLEEEKKRGPVAPSSSSPFLFFPPCMERNENISRGAPGSFLFIFFFPLPGNWTNGRISSIIPFPSSHSPSIYPCFLSLSFQMFLYSAGKSFRKNLKRRRRRKTVLLFLFSIFFIRPPPLPASDYADSPRSHFSFSASVHQ